MLTTQWLSEHRNCYFDIDCVQNAPKYLVHVLDTTAVFRKLRRLRQVAQKNVPESNSDVHGALLSELKS